MFSISKPTLFLLISANLFSISASVFDCSLIPTAFWCLNPAIAHQCLIDDQCSHHQSAYRNHPIQITLLYEALCGGCQQFILDVLEPKIYQPLKDIVDIQLVPYGNSRMKKNGTITCQHGEYECFLNKLESCVIYYMSSKRNAALEFIVCLERFVHNGTEHATALAACFKQYKVADSTQKKISTCVNGPLGGQLQASAGQLTDAVTPEKHQWVPWIVVNGVSLSSLQDTLQHLDAFICYWYEGEQKASSCNRADRYQSLARNYVSN